MSLLRRAITLLVLCASSLAIAESLENPMNHVGEQHNQYLACLQKVDPLGERNPFELLVNSCAFDPGMPADEFITTYTALMPSDLLAPMDVMLEPYRGELTDAQYAYMSETERILSTRSPEEAAVALAELESRAVESLGRENADLAVLSSLATARHSASYWTENPPQPAAKAKWWQVVLGDAVGGLVGGLVGGPTGAVGLGVGCSKAVASL
jgi:hypothetical protein